MLGTMEPPPSDAFKSLNKYSILQIYRYLQTIIRKTEQNIFVL